MELSGTTRYGGRGTCADAFGQNDGFALIEAPDNTTAGGVALAITSSGAVCSVQGQQKARKREHSTRVRARVRARGPELAELCAPPLEGLTSFGSTIMVWGRVTVLRRVSPRFDSRAKGQRHTFARSPQPLAMLRAPQAGWCASYAREGGSRSGIAPRLPRFRLRNGERAQRGHGRADFLKPLLEPSNVRRNPSFSTCRTHFGDRARSSNKCARDAEAFVLKSNIRRSFDVRRYTTGMARFEKRISDEEVSAARAKIAAGATLRSAAAEIPCAPSTLSVRIKKAEAAEGTRGQAPLSEQELLAAGRPEYLLALKRIGLGLVAGASPRDQLSALKELLRHEPVAAAEKDAYGSVWYVYPDRIEPGEETDAPGAALGEEPRQP